jgi:thymidylate synthase
MLVMHKITARDLPDLWFQAVHDILIYGRQFKIDRGSYEGQTRLEYDYFTGMVANPGHGSGTPEILPQIPEHIGIPNPVEFEYIYGGKDYERSYVEYVMTPTKQPGESYTYGERLTGYQCSPFEMDAELLVEEDEVWGNKNIIKSLAFNSFILNQVELAIWTYKNKGHRNNQIVLQVARPDDMLLIDPPCLRHIDTRIQDGKLHFIVYFRSWDLWGGLPANLAGIQALKEYMAGEIGVEDGSMIVESKGLHLYGYAEDLAKMRCMK